MSMPKTKSMFRLAIVAMTCVIFLDASHVARAAVPEIDPGSMAGGLTLLGGCLLMLFDRRKSS